MAVVVAAIQPQFEQQVGDGLQGCREIGIQLADGIFGDLALGDFFVELAVGVAQLGGAFRHFVLQLFAVVLQLGVLRFQLLLHGAQLEVGIDPRHDFVDLQGFGDVVHPPGLETRDLAADIGQRRHEDHRDVAGTCLRLQAAADFEAVDPRHHNVEQDEFGQHIGDALQRLFAVLRDHHATTGAFQAFDDHPHVGGVVVHDQDRGSGAFDWRNLFRFHVHCFRSRCCSISPRIALD